MSSCILEQLRLDFELAELNELAVGVALDEKPSGVRELYFFDALCYYALLFYFSKKLRLFSNIKCLRMLIKLSISVKSLKLCIKMKMGKWFKKFKQ